MRTIDEELQTLKLTTAIKQNFVDTTMQGIYRKEKSAAVSRIILTLSICILSIYIASNSFQQKYVILSIVSLLLVYVVSIETFISRLRITSTMKKYFISFAKVTSIASLSTVLIVLIGTSSTIATEQLMSTERKNEIRKLIQERVNYNLGAGVLNKTNSDEIIYKGISEEEKKMFEQSLKDEKDQDKLYAKNHLDDYLTSAKMFSNNQSLSVEVGGVSTASNADITAIRLFNDSEFFEVGIYSNKIVGYGLEANKKKYVPETPVANERTYEQLEQQALVLVKREEPQLDLSTLEYTQGNKTNINEFYFFRWQTKNKNEVRFIQVGLKNDGTLVSYTNGF